MHNVSLGRSLAFATIMFLAFGLGVAAPAPALPAADAAISGVIHMGPIHPESIMTIDAVLIDDDFPFGHASVCPPPFGQADSRCLGGYVTMLVPPYSAEGWWCLSGENNQDPTESYRFLIKDAGTGIPFPGDYYQVETGVDCNDTWCESVPLCGTKASQGDMRTADYRWLL